MGNGVEKTTDWDQVLREGNKHPVGLITEADGRTLYAMERKGLVYRSGPGDWLLTEKGHERASALVAAEEAGQARSAETYVLASNIGPTAVGSDLDALKRHAEQSLLKAAYGSEFDWRPDPYVGWTSRVLLYYKSPDTGRWNKQGFYIDTVKVLGNEEQQ